MTNSLIVTYKFLHTRGTVEVPEDMTVAGLAAEIGREEGLLLEGSKASPTSKPDAKTSKAVESDLHDIPEKQCNCQKAGRRRGDVSPTLLFCPSTCSDFATSLIGGRSQQKEECTVCDHAQHVMPSGVAAPRGNCGMCRTPLAKPCIVCADTIAEAKTPETKCHLAMGDCKHIFHYHCLSTWLLNHSTCPTDSVPWTFAGTPSVGTGRTQICLVTKDQVLHFLFCCVSHPLTSDISQAIEFDMPKSTPDKAFKELLESKYHIPASTLLMFG